MFLVDGSVPPANCLLLEEIELKFQEGRFGIGGQMSKEETRG